MTLAPKHASLLRRLAGEDGTTMIEVTIASAIMLVMMAGLLSMGAVATMHTENQGHLAARTTEYAQDKMEQLLALSYGDAVTNTAFFPAAPSGGSGLAVGGSTNTASPIDKYVDWLAADGSLLGGGTAVPPTWFYKRVWAITFPPSTSGLKQITVVTTVKSSVGGAMIPKSTVVALKSSQF